MLRNRLLPAAALAAVTALMTTGCAYNRGGYCNSCGNGLSQPAPVIGPSSYAPMQPVGTASIGVPTNTAFAPAGGMGTTYVQPMAYGQPTPVQYGAPITTTALPLEPLPTY